MALIEIDDFPSELKLHLWLGFSTAMLVITRWYFLASKKIIGWS